MSIDDDLQHDHSITDISRALDLFTDRLKERRHFASYLNDPARNTILFSMVMEEMANPGCYECCVIAIVDI